MKKQLFFAFILLCLASTGIKAQTIKEFAPVGAEWHYEYFYLGPDGTANSYVKFECTGKIQIQEMECSVIEEFRKRLCGRLVDTLLQTHYLFQDGEQVYEVENEEKYLLYDFSKDSGEYWLLPKYSDTVFVSKRENIVLSDGDTCIQITVMNALFGRDWYFSGNITNRFGKDEGTLFPNPATVGCGGVNHLRCYSENSEFIYKKGSLDCEYDHSTVGIEDHLAANNIWVQNPIHDRISIHLTDNPTQTKVTSVVIYNTLGQIVKYEKIDSNQSKISIPFSDMPQGIYLIRLNFDDQSNRTLKTVKL